MLEPSQLLEFPVCLLSWILRHIMRPHCIVLQVDQMGSERLGGGICWSHRRI
jgi:hypothetical protein